MYDPLHEAAERKFVEVLGGRMKSARFATRLSIQRKNLSLSQVDLAQRAGVGLRSIQMYEQRNKDINHASSETLYKLARALHCSMTDLMEL